jgi:hypothetical protein
MYGATEKDADLFHVIPTVIVDGHGANSTRVWARGMLRR